MARHCKRFGVVLGLLAGALASPGPARAYEEQLGIDVALGYALISPDDLPVRQGPSIELGASYGVWDAVVLRGALGYAYLRESPRDEHVGRLRLEGLYQLDVLQVVPFFGVGALLTTKQIGDGAPLRGGLQLVLGVDYLASRTWTAGIDVRSGLLLDAGALINATDVALRISRMFETF